MQAGVPAWGSQAIKKAVFERGGGGCFASGAGDGGRERTGLGCLAWPPCLALPLRSPACAAGWAQDTRLHLVSWATNK